MLKNGRLLGRNDGFLTAELGVQAPVAAAVGGEKKEDEAQQDRRFPVVLNGPKTLGLVEHEIGHRHLARDDESGRAGEEAQEDQEPAEEFQHPADADQGEEFGMAAEFGGDSAEPVKELHAAGL